MKAINFGHIVEKYKGMWVALTDSYSVISSGRHPTQVLEKALKKGYQKPTLFKVPKENTPFIGGSGSYVSL